MRISFLNNWQFNASLLVILTIFFHIGIILNPGFYSHDEWDKFDYVQRLGLWPYIWQLMRIFPGPEFGYPVRPWGFAQQAISSVWMVTAPVIPHLIDVLIRAAAAVVIYLAIDNLGFGRRVAMAAGALFALSPLAVMATGWVGASFDQWYTLFTCLACWAACRAFVDGLTLWRAAGILAASFLAIVSKEAAIIVPVAVGLSLLALMTHRPFTWRQAVARGGTIVVLAAIPIIIYLAIRFPALLVTFSGQGVASYKPTSASILTNLFAYFALPFTPNASEDIIPRGRLGAMGAGAHVVLLLGVWLYGGARLALIYLATYLLFVFPVMSLPSALSHYAYGSAVPQAIALAFVLREAWRRRHWLSLLLWVVLVSTATLTMALVQYRLYLDGHCQTTFFNSLDTRLAAAPGVGAAVIAAHPSSRAWVGLRAIHGRPRYSGQNGAPLVVFSTDARAESLSDPLRVMFQPNCLVH